MNRRQLLTTLTAIPLTTWAARLKTLTYNPKTSPLTAIAHKIKHIPVSPEWKALFPMTPLMNKPNQTDNSTRKLGED